MGRGGWGRRGRQAGPGCRQQGGAAGRKGHSGQGPCSPVAVSCAPGWWHPWDMALGPTGGSGAVTGVQLNLDSPEPSRWSQGSSPGRAGPGSSPVLGQGRGWGQAEHISAHHCLGTAHPLLPWSLGCPSPFEPRAGRGGGSLPAHQLNCGVCDKCPQLTLLVTFNPLFAASRSTKQPPGTSRRYSLSGVS